MAENSLTPRYPDLGLTAAAKSEKKIVEFMTEVIPRNQYRVTFHCPQNFILFCD